MIDGEVDKNRDQELDGLMRSKKVQAFWGTFILVVGILLTVGLSILLGAFGTVIGTLIMIGGYGMRWYAKEAIKKSMLDVALIPALDRKRVV